MHSTARMAMVVAAATLVFSATAMADTVDREHLRPAAPETNAPGVVVQSQFVAIDPCRIVDTRSSTAGILKAKQARILLVSGTTGFPAQGGKDGGCGIPAGARAVVVSLTTVKTVKGGRLTVFPNGSPRPNAISLTYPKASISNEITAALGTNGRIRAFPTTDTHLIADVVGYYAEPIAVLANSAGQIISRSPQVTSVTQVSTGVYDVFFNTPHSNCVASATASNLNRIIAVFTDTQSDRVQVYIFDNAGGPANSWFFLTLTC